MPQVGIGLGQVVRRPQPGETTAHHRHVDIDVAGQRRPDGDRLGEPVPPQRELLDSARPTAGSDLLPRFGQHRPQDAGHHLELLLAADQRRRQLHHRVTAVVGPADQSGVEEGPGEEAAQQPLGLVVVEGLPGVLVLDQLDAVEEAGAADVADDGQVPQGLERRPGRRPRSPARGRAGPRFSNTSRLAMATAQLTGWPPKVKPWGKLASPWRNGSISRSLATSAPSGE